MRCTSLFAVLALPALLTACGSDPDAAQYGPEPKLPDRQRGLLPSMEIANPAQWGDQQPMVPQGYTITPVAPDLEIPRQIGRASCRESVWQYVSISVVAG